MIGETAPERLSAQRMGDDVLTFEAFCTREDFFREELVRASEAGDSAALFFAEEGHRDLVDANQAADKARREQEELARQSAVQVGDAPTYL